MTSPDLTFAREVLDAQPFSRLLGTRITAFGEGSAVLELDLDDDLRQHAGLVHGGVLAYLADNAVAFAAGSLLGTDVVTSGLTLEYLESPATGPLVAAAVVDRSARRHAVCRVTVSSPEGVAAMGQARVTARGGARAEAPHSAGNAPQVVVT